MLSRKPALNQNLLTLTVLAVVAAITWLGYTALKCGGIVDIHGADGPGRSLQITIGSPDNRCSEPVEPVSKL